MTSNTTETSAIYNHLHNNVLETTESLDRTGSAVKPTNPLDSTKVTVELEATNVSTNLAILPVLAILIFLTCVCLKCCSWFRDSVKDRDEGDVENSGFIILNEGDNEYKDVEFRSDTNSCYDTVSSYTSFIKRNNQYDTVTSIRSLQPSRQWDAYNTYNSYRSFLLQRLDGSKYNTVNSVRSLLRNATEMKDAEVQVELVDPVRRIALSHASARRHNSIDAIPLHNRSSSESGYTDEIKQHRDLKRGHRHRVSFVDSKGPKRVVDGRSLSMDASHLPLTDDNVHKNSLSLKHLWGIRDQPRLNPANRYSPPRSLPKRPSPPQVRHPQLVDAATSPTMDHTTPSRKHRFKVTKADESQLPTKVQKQNQKHCASKSDDPNNKMLNSATSTSEHCDTNALASCEQPSLLRSCHRHSTKINEHTKHIKTNICEKSNGDKPANQLHISCDSDAHEQFRREHNSCRPAQTFHSNESNDQAYLSYETPAASFVNANECHNANIDFDSNIKLATINDVSKDTDGYPEICSPRRNQIDDEEQDVGFCSDDTDSGVCNELTAFLNEEDTRL
ncbi:hypothetical protein LOTGIDRAFT_174897 [Lottia gigantea]|uniref:Uncharacterized protein n=1 Tax=Lottia gigantea TaxID=225164 RepID=V4C3Z7_LOTGI|nr:hypothetical protein LOTGIDRAFT_174897 [Lottia gigantea]ESO96279.1 hypothetical protein LOTGIDRAFT_174897 [Lottia gigantea]